MKFIDTLKVFDRLKKQRIFEDYAVGGAIAVAYYVRARSTMDMDIFLLTDDEGYEVTWKRLEKLGYEHMEDSIVVEGVPVDIIPSRQHPFYEEAIKYAEEVKIDDIQVKIFTPEYLIATKLLSFRSRDKNDISDLFRYEKINMGELKDILSGGFEGEEELLTERLHRILEEKE